MDRQTLERVSDTINLADHVAVRLTAVGRRIHYQNWLARSFPERRLRPVEYVPPRELDGISIWTLRELMREFGAALEDGKPDVFEGGEISRVGIGIDFGREEIAYTT